jgi:hypothetical protein
MPDTAIRIANQIGHACLYEVPDPFEPCFVEVRGDFDRFTP